MLRQGERPNLPTRTGCRGAHKDLVALVMCFVTASSFILLGSSPPHPPHQRRADSRCPHLFLVSSPIQSTRLSPSLGSLLARFPSHGISRLGTLEPACTCFGAGLDALTCSLIRSSGTRTHSIGHLSGVIFVSLNVFHYRLQ